MSLFAVVALAACGGGGGGGGGGQQQQNNTPPTVAAGNDLTITLPETAALTGQATDSQGQTLTYQWSGPAGVTFSSATSASTTATFAAAGTYTLTLTVSDGSLTGSDSLVVTVNAAENTAPTVDAGADQTITLPAAATLAGSATDADGDALTYAWTSEPAAGVTFADAAAANTTATFAAAGTYTLTLTANDGATTGSDALTVIVNASTSTVFWPAIDNDDSVADHGWTRVTPAEVGMQEAPLNEAATYALTAGGAGMVVRGGRLVHSWAAPSVSIDTRFASQSATKSIGGMAIGIAMERDLISDDLSELAHTLLSNFGERTPGGSEPPNDPGQLQTITLAQLATHIAGFEKDRSYPALEFAPATNFNYSDGGLNWLADVLTTVFNQDLSTVLRDNVWSQLGVNPQGALQLDDVQWRTNISHAPTLPNSTVATRELSSGIQINANAMARVGLLYLRNGEWSTGRVLPPSFIELSKAPRNTVGINNPDSVNFPGAPGNYGVLWWTNQLCQLSGVPRDAFWAWGQYESLIVVIPSLDLVISRIGPNNPGVQNERRFGESDWNADYAVLEPFLNPIVAATGATGTVCQ